MLSRCRAWTNCHRQSFFVSFCQSAILDGSLDLFCRTQMYRLRFGEIYCTMKPVAISAQLKNKTHLKIYYFCKKKLFSPKCKRRWSGIVYGFQKWYLYWPRQISITLSLNMHKQECSVWAALAFRKTKVAYVFFEMFCTTTYTFCY